VAIPLVRREELVMALAVSHAKAYDILELIAEGYKWELTDEGFIVVDNPDFQEDNGKNPKLVMEICMENNP
jgi:hypothetical protein